MNDLKIGFALCAFALFLTPRLGSAQIYDTAAPAAFSVDSIAIISSPIPHAGDTMQMLLRFHSSVTEPAVLTLGYPGTIAPPNQGTETRRDSNITVDSGTVYTYYIPLKLFGYGGSMVSTVFQGLGITSAFRNYGYSHLEIESSTTSFRILNLGNNANDTGTMTASGTLSTGAHIHLTGKVDYEDKDQEQSPLYDPSHALVMRGASGVTVVLLFHSINVAPGMVQGCPSGQLNRTFVHPIGGCIPSGEGLTTPGVHSCHCDVDGNFSFDFSISDATWANYENAELLVTAKNDAAFLESNAGDEVSTYTIIGTGTTCSPWTTFRETYGRCIPCNNTALIIKQVSRLV